MNKIQTIKAIIKKMSSKLLIPLTMALGLLLITCILLFGQAYNQLSNTNKDLEEKVTMYKKGLEDLKSTKGQVSTELKEKEIEITKKDLELAKKDNEIKQLLDKQREYEIYIAGIEEQLNAIKANFEVYKEEFEQAKTATKDKK